MRIAKVVVIWSLASWWMCSACGDEQQLQPAGPSPCTQALEHVATFSGIPGVAWSDHLSFWRQGYRALMVTDTAFYRYTHYHTEGDTPDKVEFRVVFDISTLPGACRGIRSVPPIPRTTRDGPTEGWRRL